MPKTPTTESAVGELVTTAFKKHGGKGNPRPRVLRQHGKNALGIKKREWNREWREDMAQVTRCESCGRPEDPSDPQSKLTTMHALKQRFITTREAYRRAAKVCWREHYAYDFATGEDPHGKMAAFVDGLIAKRPFDIDNKETPPDPDTARPKREENIMRESIEGYRRSAVKTRDKKKLEQKLEEFHDRGEETMVRESAGIYYIYIKKEKPLGE